jgi:transposase
VRVGTADADRAVGGGWGVEHGDRHVAWVSRPTVIGWRDRYLARGVAGLDDEPRSGRPRTIDHAAIITATLRPPPKKYGVTHWSTRLLARHLDISDATVAKAWREYRVQPWRAESFRFSTDRELVGKVTDVVGLYLNPAENGIVLCVDEKSQIQALDRTAPILPLQPGLAERRSHDYVRHGTSTLFAALDIATGQVTGACKPRHRHQEFLAFLKQVTRAYPEGELHLMMDNYAAHKHPNVKKWLGDNPRVVVHFTPTHASWMNLVEVWCSLIERKPSTAAPSGPSATSTPRSARSSTAGTTAHTRSSGPKLPTRSSGMPTVKKTSNAGH